MAFIPTQPKPSVDGKVSQATREVREAFARHLANMRIRAPRNFAEPDQRGFIIGSVRL